MRPAGERNEIFWNNLVSAARRLQKVAWSTRHVIIPAFLLIRAAEIGALSWLPRITCVCVLPGGITAALGWNKAKYLPSANLMRVLLLKRARAERINCATRNVCCPAVVSQRAWCCTGASVITIITHRTHPQSTYCCCCAKCENLIWPPDLCAILFLRAPLENVLGQKHSHCYKNWMR